MFKCFFVLAASLLPFGLLAQSVMAAQRGEFSRLGWNWEPWILASLALAAFGYILGLLHIPNTVRPLIFGCSRCASFAAGIFLLFIVLISPFDALDDQLFSAHMAQHLVLLMIAPPLLILGRPTQAYLWAFPPPARRAIGYFWNRSVGKPVVHALRSPVFVWILSSAVIWFWHLPAPFGWALSSEPVHAFEHVCFFGSSLMFWSVVLQPLGSRRLEYGATLAFVGTFGVQNGLLGALLTFAGRPIYAGYLPTTAAFGLTPLEDQQFAGLIMWIPTSLIHLTTLGALFVAWLHESERRTLLASKAPSNARLLDAALR